MGSQNLFIHNFPFATTEQELRNLFSEYGEVASVKIVVDRENGRSKGYGFVEMQAHQAAQRAIDDLDGATFGGRELHVRKSEPKPRRRADFAGRSEVSGEDPGRMRDKT